MITMLAIFNSKKIFNSELCMICFSIISMPNYMYSSFGKVNLHFPESPCSYFMRYKNKFKKFRYFSKINRQIKFPNHLLHDVNVALITETAWMLFRVFDSIEIVIMILVNEFRCTFQMNPLEFYLPSALTSIYFRYIFTTAYIINYYKVNRAAYNIQQRIVNHFPCVALNIRHFGKFCTILEYLS